MTAEDEAHTQAKAPPLLDSALLAHSALAIRPVPLLASNERGSGAASRRHSARPPPAPRAASLSPQREKRAACGRPQAPAATTPLGEACHAAGAEPKRSASASPPAPSPGSNGV